jgi:hypothetical protein
LLVFAGLNLKRIPTYQKEEKTMLNNDPAREAEIQLQKQPLKFELPPKSGQIMGKNGSSTWRLEDIPIPEPKCNTKVKMLKFQQASLNGRTVIPLFKDKKYKLPEHVAQFLIEKEAARPCLI